MSGWILFRKVAIGAVALATLYASAATADGTETLGTPSIFIESGTGIVSAGVGVAFGQPGTINVNVPVGAIVAQALLYWEGMNSNAAEFTPTMSILVDGSPVVGDAIGGPTQFKTYSTVSYRADITSFVTDGANSLEIDGLDFVVDNDGAGVVVIFDDGGKEAHIEIRDGNDYAYEPFAPADTAVTVLQTFTFPKSNKADRAANVDIFVGSVAGGAGSGGTCRPSSYEITTGGVTATFPDQLDSLDGLYWDTIRQTVTVPKGETSLTVQLFSRDDRVRCPGNNPASMDWITAGLSLETPPAGQCWITTGGYHNAGSASGSKDFTFGGNVGPPPRGSWEVIDHNTGDNFHAFDVSIVECNVIKLTGPGQPGGKKGFEINEATFEGFGRLNGVDGFPFVGFVQDAGEPSGKNDNDQDFFSITVRDPDTNAIVFEASATLDGGNVQIHPPSGGGKKN